MSQMTLFSAKSKYECKMQDNVCCPIEWTSVQIRTVIQMCYEPWHFMKWLRVLILRQPVLVTYLITEWFNIDSSNNIFYTFIRLGAGNGQNCFLFIRFTFFPPSTNSFPHVQMKSTSFSADKNTFSYERKTCMCFLCSFPYCGHFCHQFSSLYSLI